ncbi:cytochrome P450 4C1-like [Bacillus rossius redtenbacheri]|uniref:cytochrome P450 4C1-like n=1 Tax=Bacillus rossius redtenbacheri TaxID=93214 RepID=UPI002FDDB388
MSPVTVGGMLCQVAVVCALLAVVISFVRFRTSHYYQLLKRIPGPKGLPILGNLREIFESTDRLLEFIADQRRKHGPISIAWVGPYCGLLVCDPQDVEVVLSRSSALAKPRPYKLLELYLGYSLITADPTDWKRFHKIITPAFGLPTLKSFIPVFNEKSRILVEVLKRHEDGQPFEMLDYMMMCTLDIVTETSLGSNMNVLKDRRFELVRGLSIAEDEIFFGIIRPWFWIPAFVKLTPTYKKMKNGIKAVWDYADYIIAKKLEDNSSQKVEPIQENTDESKGKERLGFLEHVISGLKDTSPLLKRDEIKDNTLTVIVGGMGTGSLVMSAALMLLGLHRDVQEKVVKELEHIFGDDIDRTVTYEDLKQMVYLEQVINETMRLYPPVPFTGREATEEINLTKYTLPAGTYIGIPISLIHRNPEYFPDPDKFDPDRFSPENSANRHPFSFIPFLGGRRMCIGKKYAYMQMKIILSTVLRSYEVLPCGSREEMEQLQFKMTLHMVNGCNVKLIPRKK